MAGQCSIMTANSPLMCHKLCSQLVLHNALCMLNVCLGLCFIRVVSSGILIPPHIRWWTIRIRALGLHLTMLIVVNDIRLQPDSQCMLQAAHAAVHDPWVCHVTVVKTVAV